MYTDDAIVLVMDNGSGSCKAGFAGDDAPRAVFPSLVGHLTPVPSRSRVSFVGKEAQVRRDMLYMSHPIERGIVTNWDDMEMIWNHTYDLLRVKPADHPVLLTEAPLIPKTNRERMVQTMFETFDVPALYVTVGSPLTLHSAGRVTGVVLDCGHDVTSAVPVYEGYAIPAASRKVDSAGKQLTTFLRSILRDRCPHNRVSEEAVDKIKEKNCYVALSYERELNSWTTGSDVKCKIDDKETLSVGHERFRCPEALFQPSFLWKYSPSIADLLNDAISSCDPELKADMYANVVLTGGSTMFPGLSMRLHREMRSLAPAAKKIRIVASRQREYSAWIGGSQLASLPSFPFMCITKQEYDEYGQSVVHWKCF